MRFFNFKADSVTQPESVKKIDGVEQLRQFRDIGDEFNYLGLRMVVTHLYELRLHGRSFPMLDADYVDNSGRLRQSKFSLRELPVLIKQNQGST